MLLPDICSLPIDVGNGDKKNIKRYAYNAKKSKCVTFKYTGSGGNENNFEDKKKCKQACSVSNAILHQHHFIRGIL